MRIKQLMFLNAIIKGGGVPVEEQTVTGNPVRFETVIARALTGLTIPFTPTQIGSGAPAPGNVRPIYGRTSINIYHAGVDTTSPTVISVSWQTEHGEIYGGTLDAVTGILTVEWVKNSAKWGSIIFKVDDSMTQGNLNIPYSIYEAVESGAANYNICNVAKYLWTGTTNTTPHFYTGYSASYKQDRAYIILPNGTDPETVVTVVSKLIEPFTVQLAPVLPIATYFGENNLWTDTNGTNTVKYLVKR